MKPVIVYVTSACTSQHDVVDIAAAAVAGGARWIQMREPGLPDREAVDLARRLVGVARPGGAGVLVNDRPDIALAADADGVHLKSSGLEPGAVRVLGEARGREWFISVAAHDAAGLIAAASQGANACTIGPIGAVPGKRGLGMEGLRTLLDAARAATDRLPTWIALGGLDASSAAALGPIALPDETWGLAAVRAFQDVTRPDGARAVAASWSEYHCA